METEARYTLVGVFTALVIAAGFVFVYWLKTAGGFSERIAYDVRFDSSVSGLVRGSAVLFNGLRVGEVASLSLSPEAPGRVMATITVERATPVRADTRATIEFQGLTGAPAVSLLGGTQSAPALPSGSGPRPLIVAEPDAGKSLGQTARDALRHVDAVITENAEPLRNLVSNINTFSTALARNSDRVDGIVSGIERLTGGGAKAEARTYEIAPASNFPGLGKAPTGQIIIPELTTLALYDSDKLLFRSPDGDKPATATAKWPDVLPKLLQARLIQSLENAGYLRALSRSPDGAPADATLLVDLRAFHIALDDPGKPQATVELAAKILGPEGKLIAARSFKTTTAVASATPTSTSPAEPARAAAALSESFGRVAGDLVVWMFTTL